VGDDVYWCVGSEERGDGGVVGDVAGVSCDFRGGVLGCEGGGDGCEGAGAAG
jgi:hypothetical protein